MRVGLLYMCKNQRGLRAPEFAGVLCFEEGDEWGPVFSREKAQTTLRVLDSEHRGLVRLTQNDHPGPKRNPYRNVGRPFQKSNLFE